MIMTYDFIFYAQRDAKFMKQIKDCIKNETDTVLYTKIHKLYFNGKEKVVIVESLSDTSKYHEKVIPKAIKYEDLIKMLGGQGDTLLQSLELFSDDFMEERIQGSLEEREEI